MTVLRTVTHINKNEHYVVRSNLNRKGNTEIKCLNVRYACIVEVCEALITLSGHAIPSDLHLVGSLFVFQQHNHPNYPAPGSVRAISPRSRTDECCTDDLATTITQLSSDHYSQCRDRK